VWRTPVRILPITIGHAGDTARQCGNAVWMTTSPCRHRMIALRTSPMTHSQRSTPAIPHGNAENDPCSREYLIFAHTFATESGTEPLLRYHKHLGKTHIATGLALSACRQGHAVRFFTAASLVYSSTSKKYLRYHVPFEAAQRYAWCKKSVKIGRSAAARANGVRQRVPRRGRGGGETFER
jgi:hypothetical protein